MKTQILLVAAVASTAGAFSVSVSLFMHLWGWEEGLGMVRIGRLHVGLPM